VWVVWSFLFCRRWLDRFFSKQRLVAPIHDKCEILRNSSVSKGLLRRDRFPEHGALPDRKGYRFFRFKILNGFVLCLNLPFISRVANRRLVPEACPCHTQPETPPGFRVATSVAPVSPKSNTLVVESISRVINNSFSGSLSMFASPSRRPPPVPAKTRSIV